MAGEWQDIATAPKDTDIDLWVVERYVLRTEANHAERICGARWTTCRNPKTGEEYEGWCEWEPPYWKPITTDLSGGARYPTHWMPLPPPPSQERADP